MKFLGAKFLFVCGFLTLSIATPALITSCNSSGGQKYSTSDIGGLGNEFDDKKELIASNIQQIKNGKSELEIKTLMQKTIQITANGKVNDQSFNQSVWEAISRISLEIGNEHNSYYETNKLSQATQNEAYDYALAKNYKIWVLTGFQQEALLQNWLKIGRNKERFISNKTVVISVDWYSEELAKECKGQILGLNFRTQEASFVVGYSAAKLLGTKFSGDSNKKERYLNSFAGGDFSGATNFNYGFYEGIRQWNSEQGDDNSKKVKISQEDINLSVGFAQTTEAMEDIKLEVNKNTPKVTMPVAGTLVSTTIDLIKEKSRNGKEQWIIGVDTDQTLTFPSEKEMIMTSSEKKVGVAVYKSLINLFGLNKPKVIFENDFIGDFELYVNSHNIQGGYNEGFVGTSKSFLKNYADEFNEILATTKKEFFDNDKLKPPTEYSEEEKKQSAFDINNVRVGYMTKENKENYFLRVINEINKWDK